MTVLNAPGGGVAYSRFGHAIAPLGDLDDDGFDGKYSRKRSCNRVDPSTLQLVYILVHT